MLKKLITIFTCILSASIAWSTAIIDQDVLDQIEHAEAKISDQDIPSIIPTIIFLDSIRNIDAFIQDTKVLHGVETKKINRVPAVLTLLPAEKTILQMLANHPAARQISSYQAGAEELEFSEQAILLRPSALYPTISNWWDNGYAGHGKIIGLIDSGIDINHPGLNGKNIIVRQEPGSGYDDFTNGVRSAHGTGVACIYTGTGSTVYPNDRGIAWSAPTIISGLAGEGDGNMEDLALTFSSLDWMLNRSGYEPDIINYSFGHGPINCANCTDWSGLAKIVDYVINHHHILWVKSAGNGGYVAPSNKAPYDGTITSPGDNYNALTIANMNPTRMEAGVLSLTPDRAMHGISYTSSRGPTLLGRKKPDISAPGNNTRTCAPDPAIFPFIYTKTMDYHDGYRLMGGTSSAAPHVGAAALLLQEAGITSPMAQKALLINAADAYTDNNSPGPNDPNYPYEGGHYPVMGSEWNRTYGWGYLNLQNAFLQRQNVIEDQVSIQQPEKIYIADLPVGAKITLVHERRVGYNNGIEWRLSQLKLEIIDAATHAILARDDSVQDNVHQVANCQRNQGDKKCSASTQLVHALIKITLVSPFIDGAITEPFALVASTPLDPYTYK